MPEAPSFRERLYAAAQEYIADGIAIFPLLPASKVPATPHGFKDASVAPEMALAWNPDASDEAFNIGIATGSPSGGLCVLDIDPAKGGEESFAKLLRDRGLECPLTYTVRTGGGGRHLYFLAHEGQIGLRSYGSAYPGIDVRGEGGYVVAPPSQHASGAFYEVELAVPPIEWPSALLPPTKTPTKAPALERGEAEIDEAETTCPRAKDALLRAKVKLASMPEAIEGKNGSAACFLAAVECARFGLSAGEVFNLLVEDYNPRCQPEWSEGELAHKVEDAFSTSLLAKDAIAVNDKLEEKLGVGQTAENAKAEAAERGDNFCYFAPAEKYVVRWNGRWRLDQLYGKDGMRHILIAMGHEPKIAREMLASEMYDVAVGATCVATDAEFVRDEENGGLRLINTYAPPSLVPKEGQCPSIMRIVRMLTGDDARGMEWIFNWAAALVQRPDVRGPTAAAFYSKHTGTGKTTLGRILSTIVGKHNSAEIGQAQLNSSFNSTYANALFVVANEAFATKQLEDQRNRMKALITDATITVNRKNVQEYEAPNRTTWLLTTNKLDAVQPEGETDRRWSIFESGVPDKSYKTFLAALFNDQRDFSDAMLEEIAAFAWALHAHAVDWELAATPYENAARAAVIAKTKPIEEVFLDECAQVGPAEMVRTNPPEWWSQSKPPEREWHFGEYGVAQPTLIGAFQTFCRRNEKRGVYSGVLTAAARQRGITVKRQSAGARAKIYTGWPDPEVVIDPATPPGKLLSMAMGPDTPIGALRGGSPAYTGKERT